MQSGRARRASVGQRGPVGCENRSDASRGAANLGECQPRRIPLRPAGLGGAHAPVPTSPNPACEKAPCLKMCHAIEMWHAARSLRAEARCQAACCSSSRECVETSVCNARLRGRTRVCVCGHCMRCACGTASGTHGRCGQFGESSREVSGSGGGGDSRHPRHIDSTRQGRAQWSVCYQFALHI